MPIGTAKGFGVTFRQIFNKPITQEYPEFKRPVYPRFRGRHRLHVHENGLEKCVGCSLCAAACPADCIRVVPAENTADNRVSAGERYARIYEINMSRCIFCGYCELACPFDAITLGNEYEISEYSRDDLIYTKDMLLAEPMKKDPGRRPRALRHAHPGLQVLQLMGDVLVWTIWIRRRRGCLGSGLAVITFTNPFFSALALIGNLGSLAVLFLLASAEFLAAAQVLVYAGAVMVMFLFVIAYLGDRTAGPLKGGPSWISLAAIVAAAALLVEIVVVIGLTAGDALTDEATDRGLVRQPGGDRAPVPDRSPARVRDHLDRAADRRRRRCRARDALARRGRGGARRVRGPDVSWYLIVAAILFSIGTAGVLLRRSPLIVLLSLEIMLNSANLALIAFARLHGEPRRSDLRARRDGRRRLRGRRRPRPDRRDRAQAARPRRRPAPGAPRMIVGAWLCLLAPLAGALAITLLGERISRQTAAWLSTGSVFTALRRRGRGARRPARPRPRGAGAGHDRLDLARRRRLRGRPLAARRPAGRDDDADRLRRRRADRPLLGRLHARRPRGAALLRVHGALRLLDADARAGGATSCCCSSAGGSSASPRTC